MCHNSDNTLQKNINEQKKIIINADKTNENELNLNKPHENLLENNGGQQAGPALKSVDISQLNIKINAEKKKVFEPVKDTAIGINADLQKNRYLMESVDIISTAIPIEIERLKTYTNELSSVTRSKLAHDINRALKPIIDMLEKPIGSTDNKAVIRLMNILASHLDVAMEKCSTYLLTKKPRTSNGKDNYEKVHDIFCLVNVFQRLAKQKAMDIENAGKNLDSMFKSDTTFAGLLSKRDYINGNDISQLIEDENQTNITLKSDKKFVVKEQKNIGIEQMHAQALARLIGLDHTVTDYDLMMAKKGKDSYVYGIAKQVGKGNTIGELLEQGKIFHFSKEANAQLFKLQIWDILTGNMHNMKDIQVSYTSGKEGNTVYVDKVIGYGDRISFTGNTFTKLDSLKFKHIDPEMVKTIKAIKANTYFIDSMKLSENHKKAFMTRLDALIARIDEITEEGKDVQKANFDSEYTRQYVFDYRDQFKDLYSHTKAYMADDDIVARNYRRDIEIKLLDNSNFKGGLTQREVFNRNNKDSKINKAFSKASHFISTYVMFPFRLANKAVLNLAGAISKKSQPKLEQEDIIENRIPGKLLENSKFDEGLAGKVETEADNQEIIDDSRMLPLAFEEAVPINEDEPPYVSIKIEQPTEGTDKTGSNEDREHGHVMLELEYTKMNNGHKQRYRTRFGFYPAAGYDTAFGPCAAQFTNGLVVPGVMLNDKGHDYNVGRRFKATNKQINKLILFSNSYAEKGGYNYITRSCATFVVDALKHAGVGNEDLFHKNLMGKGGFETVGAFFDSFLPISTTASLFGNFFDREYGEQDGKGYQKTGQKRLTQKEYERLFVTNDVEGWAYTPGFLGENIRAYDSKDDNDIIMADINIVKNATELLQLLSTEKDTLLDFLNTEYKDKIDKTLLSDINRDIKQLADEIIEKYNVDYDDNEYIQKAGQIRGNLKALAELINNTIKYVSKVYNITLERDKKASIPFHHFVSNLWGLLDKVIAKNDEADLDAMHVQDKQMVRDAFKGSFYVGRKEYSEELIMSMPLIVGLLEVYGSYQTMVGKMGRYRDLISNDDRTDAEDEEFNEINDDLEMAKNFISGHKYYYNSKNVTSDLATIAFNKLPKLLNESKMQINKDSKRASESLQSFDGPEQLYQYFAFDKLFKPGEKSKAKVPDRSKFNPDDMSGYISEFDSFAATIVKEKDKEPEFNLILNALLAGNTGISKEAFCNEFKNAIINSYLKVEFSEVVDNKIKSEPNPIHKDYYNYYFRKCFDDSHASLENIMTVVGDYYDLHAPKVKKDKKEDQKEKAPDKMARIEELNTKAFNEMANEKNKEKTIGIEELKYKLSLEEEAKKKAEEEEAQKKSEELAKKLQEEEIAQKKQEEEAKKQLEEADRKMAEELVKKDKEEEERRKAEEAKKKAEEAKKKAEEARKKQEEERKKKEAEEKKSQKNKINAELIKENPEEKYKRQQIKKIKDKYAKKKEQEKQPIIFENEWVGHSEYSEKVFSDSYYFEHNFDKDNNTIKKLVVTDSIKEVEDYFYMLPEGHRDRKYLEYKLEKMYKLEELKEVKKNKDYQPKHKVYKNGKKIMLNDVHQRHFQCHGSSCWSVAMENLLRYRGVDIDQDDIRMYRPKEMKELYFPTREEFKHLYGKGNEKINRDYLFNDEFGSVFEMGELVLETTNNIAVSMISHAPMDYDIMKSDNYRADAASQLSALIGNIIETANSPIAILFNGHYRTIVGVEGDTYYYKNSLPEDDFINGIERSFNDNPDKTFSGKFSDLLLEQSEAARGVIDETILHRLNITFEWLSNIKADNEGYSSELEEKIINNYNEAGQCIIYDGETKEYSQLKERTRWDDVHDQKSYGVFCKNKFPDHLKLDALNLMDNTIYIPKKLKG